MAVRVNKLPGVVAVRAHIDFGEDATPDEEAQREWAEEFAARLGKGLLDILRRCLADAVDPKLSARERNTALLTAVSVCRGLLGLPLWEPPGETATVAVAVR